MSSLNPLGKLGRAMEGKYFKDEQEYAVMRRREWLRKEGSLEKYGQEALAARRKAAPLLTSNVLTEVLGHTVRFAPKRHLDKLRDIDNDIYQKEHGRGAARRRSLLPRTYALGTQVSLGRSKYVSPTSPGPCATRSRNCRPRRPRRIPSAPGSRAAESRAAAGRTRAATGRSPRAASRSLNSAMRPPRRWSLTDGGAESIFSVRKGMEMAQSAPEGGPKPDLASLRLERLKSKTPFWSILPELTAGRAFLWGSALAVLGSAAVAKLACYQMGIRSLDELRDELPGKMENLLSPAATAVAGQLGPLRAGPGDAGDAAAAEGDASAFGGFTNSLKTWMRAKSA